MKSVGIVRQIDNLGRVTIPKEVRNNFDIEVGDPMEILVNEDEVVFKKYSPQCVFCGNTDNVIDYKDKNICSTCISTLKEKN
ncbi:AbrB/MazE/SpoVT family DNA-binding domain-containing protein [Fuchsiella alkaliacetigena]|uniref:AbrB/MazE/SpoVT family DNA-binding domain-containing protein n=1 Tax=Fuchsiella alkaliacetigena TaxID=957042 RepID=UPI00200ABF0E|nr:AbrB/MazE/SpoVT family DNA-binding domain-containing protein [Fuchsiella alkaliacetigena]MCK8826082.1 AbrB/MazE/SpoVT family DNA-binding domain-containing protein [Fuchsiella alkaliacetigena]